MEENQKQINMEINDLLSFFGADAEKIKTIDDFKNHFVSSGFIKKSEVIKDPDILSQVTGKRMGSIETIIKRTAKDAGIELDRDEIEGKQVEEIIPILGNKFKQIIEEKESALKGGNDVVNKYEEKLKRYKTDYEQYKEMAERLNNEKEDIKKNSIKQLHNYIKDTAKAKALSSIKFGDTVDELKKKGFISMLDELYELEVGEENDVYPVDKKTKKRIENPNKAGEFLSVDELFSLEAEKNKLVKQIIVNNVKTFEFKPNEAVLPSDKKKIPASKRLNTF